jgi:GNAT superfamily N-acetyltransferase
LQTTPDSLTRLIENITSVTARPRNTRIEWHDRIGARFSDAYAAVGGEDWVPLELLSRVLATPGPHRKRTAVLYRHDVPWAVVPLRLARRFWEPLMQGVVPDLAPFASTSRPGSVLATLGLNVGLWASPEPPSWSQNVRWAQSLPCYELDVTIDPESHWRSTQLWKTIVQARKRTASFELVRDDASACSWSIERWRDRFYRGVNDQVSSKWNDRVTVANWALANNWRMHSWHLRDGDRWVAGATAFEHNARLALGTIFRDPEYDWHGVGHRSLYEVCMWARQNGLQKVSFGNSFEYKRRWARPSGQHWDAIVAPRSVYAWDAVLERARQSLARFRG